MAKKINKTKTEPTHRCKDCAHCKPDLSNLSFATKEPILGTCSELGYKVLINHHYCDKFKK